MRFKRIARVPYLTFLPFQATLLASEVGQDIAIELKGATVATERQGETLHGWKYRSKT
jgi:hypothetical protein